MTMCLSDDTLLGPLCTLASPEVALAEVRARLSPSYQWEVSAGAAVWH